MSQIRYELAQTIEDLKQILILQNKNLKVALSQEEVNSQGFVTVKHDLELLKKMNNPYPHVVAKRNNIVCGYALVMLKEIVEDLPMLIPMFDKINKLTYKNISLKDSSYFIMGQVCVAKAYRGSAVFGELYKNLCFHMKRHFRFVITEIDRKNQRSIKAHAKVGFEILTSYKDKQDTIWDIIIKETQ